MHSGCKCKYAVSKMCSIVIRCKKLVSQFKEKRNFSSIAIDSAFHVIIDSKHEEIREKKKNEKEREGEREREREKKKKK